MRISDGSSDVGSSDLASNDSSKDTQLAAFGQIDWKATDRLTLTLGGRVSRTKFSFDNFQDGAPTFGPSSSSGSSKETPFTPRFGVSYEPGRDSLVYASAAKGFRPGGGNTSVPAICGLRYEERRVGKEWFRQCK